MSTPHPAARSRVATWVGLFLALFSMIILRDLFRLLAPKAGPGLNVLPPLVSRADPQLQGRLMSDLNMLAVTGGRERSEQEWRVLLEAAGFLLTRVCPVGGDTLLVQNVAILEAKPV